MNLHLNCNDCRGFLPAYISRTLPPLPRQKVAAHLDSCETCYAAYVQQRDIERELTQQVPLIGRADSPRLNRIWTAVQGEMARPRRAALRRIPARYHLVTIVAIVGLLLPSLGFQALHQRQMALALPVQPTPTETIEVTSQTVAMATAECACWLEAASVEAPEFTVPAQPNYAPNISGTQVP